MKQRTTRLRILMHVVTALYGLACLWLFYKQSVAVLSDLGASPYQSDLPLHISMIIEDGWYYSFTAFAYKLLHILFGKTTIGIALFLGIMTYGTIYATEALVCHLGRMQEKSWYSLLLSLSLNLVMPVYIRSVGAYRYVSYQAPNVWHNSTYVCMKLFALLTFLTYLKLEEKYREGITLKEWCIFAGLNIICTGIKPSFLLAFSPVMGIFLLVDLFRKVKFTRILAFGSALLPSGLVILWQNMVLFGDDTGNGIAFDPWYTFSLHASVPKLAVICSALFCGLVLVLTLKDIVKEKKYLFITCMAALGFLEALCLTEQGNRAVDGNFLWGYSFCLFVLFTVCAVKWLKMPRKGAGLAAKIGLALVYGWHLYCGLYFFISLVGGASFWMK